MPEPPLLPPPPPGHVGGETRIIKGYECSPHSQPWQVVLFQKTRLLCGATLVAPKWLLTAAHCLKPWVRGLGRGWEGAGGEDLHGEGLGDGENVHGVRKVGWRWVQRWGRVGVGDGEPLGIEAGGRDGRRWNWDGVGYGAGCWLLGGDVVWKGASTGPRGEVGSGGVVLHSPHVPLPPNPVPLAPPPVSPSPSTSDHHLSHLSQYTVHLGMHSLHRPDGWEQTRRATESFPHPDFNNSVPNKDHRNDIMLVKMASPAIITWAVRPLKLSSRCVAPGTRCLISGWGTTSSPQCRRSARGGGGGGARWGQGGHD